MVESSWQHWTQGGLFSRLCLPRLADAVADHLPPLRPADLPTRSRYAESSPHSPQQIKNGNQAHGSWKEEDGHSRSGVVCKCGQIHVRRGDRVRRGPVSNNDDEGGILSGFLGSIVRVGERQETVVVKW